LETKLKEGRGKQLLQHWGFDGNTEVARVGYSGGLALGWTLDFQVTVLIKNQHFIHIDVVNQIGDCSSITFIYGHPVLEKRKQIWDELQRIGSEVHQKWLCIGDFNQVLSVEDKFALSPLQSQVTLTFSTSYPLYLSAQLRLRASHLHG
jgi:hypothetical protein